jgi:ElaB/YqjD/DUF883 family membrane-anchored ribosome-binding protein
MLRIRRLFYLGSANLLLVCSCISIELPGQVTFLGTGSVVLKGHMSASADASCLLWVAENGSQFVLYQDARIPNDDFDAIIVPGTNSRLELTGRPDLGEPCVAGAENAEVVQILEIAGQDLRVSKFNEVRQHVDDLIASTRSRLEEKRDEIAEVLAELTEETEARLEARKNEIRLAIDEAFGAVEDQLQDRGTARARFDEFLSDVEQELDEAADELEDAKSRFTDAVRDRIDDFVENLEPSFGGPLDELEERIFEFVLDLPELKDQFTERAEEIRMELESELEQRRGEATSRLEELSHRFEEGFQSLIDELRGRINPELPDPDQEIPPILDELLPEVEELVMAIRDKADEFMANIKNDLSSLIDLLKRESEDAFGNVFAILLAEARSSDPVIRPEP